MSNWGFIHPGCAPEPGRYSNVPIEAFYGRNVQLKFETPDGRGERMWVLVHGPAETPGQELLGEVNNDPIYALDWPAGSLLEFCRNEVIKVDIIDLPPTPYQSNPSYRRNADEPQRQVERLAKSGDITAQARYLNGQVRAGQLESWKVDVLSFLGYPPATLISEATPMFWLGADHWLNRLINLIPKDDVLIRMEVRYRIVIAAMRKILTIKIPGEYPENIELMDNVLSLIERVFLEGFNQQIGAATQEFERIYSDTRWELAEIQRNTLQVLIHDKAFLTEMLMSAIHSFLISPDEKTIYESHPIQVMESLMKDSEELLPIDTGQIKRQPIVSELIPWLLGVRDSILDRHPNTLQ